MANESTVNDIVFECPHCSCRISIDKRGVGMNVACPGCKAVIHVPSQGRKARPFPKTMGSPQDFNIIEDTEEIIDMPIIQQEQGFIGKLLGNKPATTGKPDIMYNLTVTQYPSTPPAILKRLLSYGRYDFVSCLAVANPNCPLDLVIKAAKRSSTEVDPKRGQFVLYALRNPALPSDVLSELAKKSKSRMFLEAIINHLNMDSAALSELARIIHERLQIAIK